MDGRVEEWREHERIIKRRREQQVRDTLCENDKGKKERSDG